MLIASKSKVEIDRLKTQLGEEFETKDLGAANKILGMEIRRDRSSQKLFLSQKGYIERVIERFGMKSAKLVVTPLAPHFRLSSKQSPTTAEDKAYMDNVPYASAVGSLMYAMVCTRPDISQAVSVVSRFMANPGKAHWEAVKWILRYLKGTIDTGLCFGGDTCQIRGFVDSDYAGDLDRRRSTTGYVFKIHGAPVSWRSYLQATVALSTTEAEYMAMTEGFKEALWLRGLLDDLGLKQDSVNLNCDSQSAIHLAKNQIHHARTKHIDVSDFSRNYVSGTIPKSLSKIPLVTLSVTGNKITGPIPEELGQITTLEELVIEDNQLQGSLPRSLGNLKNLRRMVLAANFLNGTIPETYVNLKNLTELRLSGNMISGKIPDFIGNFTNLGSFDIQGTSLEGPIPSSLSRLTNLTILRISDLNTKSIPFPNISLMKNLLYLVLRNCSIDGPIPDNWNNLATMKHIDLSYNQLSGEIPSSMGSLLQLSYLFLTNNSISGAIPDWILNSKQHFDVSYNNFTDSAPGSCQQSNVNLVASYSSANSNSVSWCLRRDLPCPSKPQYHTLFINCGGLKVDKFEEDSTPGGPSTFFSVGDSPRWAYSSTGSFLYDERANFVATETSNPNVTGIYRTARLAPISLKYYGLCLLPGSYHVTLHFAEIMFVDDRKFDSNGRRFFDVSIQGEVMLKDFNIEAVAGGAGKEVTREFDVLVNGSTLEIYLYWSGRGTTGSPDRGVYGPLISGISVKSNFKVGRGLSAGAIVGIVLASCAILVSILGILWLKGYFGSKRPEDEELRRLGTGYFPLRQIKAATDDFDLRNKIGEGGFGPVYKGVLPDGKVIAVKQLSSKSKQGNREFINEIGMISALQHPNLVKLYGCCIEGKELLLVYEYMENNSLARALFGKKDQILHLDWRTRKRICLGIARGLAYLHEESRLKIVHRDIKATNVLLDKDLNAKISDFGLAKLDEDENTHISTRIAGTIGYMAPEYAMRGYLTDKADVYSFGVVVLEIVSGTSNTSYRPKEEFVYLLDWAYVLQEQGNLLELVDPSLGSSYSKDEASRFLAIALLCTNPSPSLRPSMSSVIGMIEGQAPVQAPLVKRTEMNDNLRFKSFQTLSQDSQTYASGSSASSQVQRSTLMDGPWMDSSISMQSNDDRSLSTTRLVHELADVNLD